MLKDLPAGTLRKYLPYALGLLALLALLSCFQMFWRANDDVAMASIADGGGQVLTPGPRLVLTNIAWGYLVYGLHLLGAAHAYATVTYLALGLSYLTLLYVFTRRDIHHWTAAALLLFVYLPTLVSPTHTLVAGYLAFAGIVLLCHSAETASLRSGILACLLLVLSSLVRWDETAFVLLVALPFCSKYLTLAWRSPLRRRWLWMLGITCVLGLGFLALDYFTFGLGEWKEYADTYGYVMALTDFRFGEYFAAHRQLLAASGYALIDLRMFSNWFYCDTAVFTAERIGALLDQVPLLPRLMDNASHYRVIPRLLDDDMLAMLLSTLVVIAVFHRRRWQLAASAGMLALLIGVLLLLGRAEVSRIYLPAVAGLLLIGALELQFKQRLVAGLFLAALLVINLPFLMHLHRQNLHLQDLSAVIRARTCALPADSLVITWGSGYPYTMNYLPFGAEPQCSLNNYGLGEYSLAPFALEHLHKYTGGKDLVPALLAGQSFDFIAGRADLVMLRRYLLRHYQADLSYDLDPTKSIRMFRVSVAPPAATAAPAQAAKQ